MIWSKLCTQLKYHRGIILVKIVYWEYPTETDGSTSLSNNTRDQGLNLYMELMRVHSSTRARSEMVNVNASLSILNCELTM